MTCKIKISSVPIRPAIELVYTITTVLSQKEAEHLASWLRYKINQVGPTQLGTGLHKLLTELIRKGL